MTDKNRWLAGTIAATGMLAGATAAFAGAAPAPATPQSSPAGITMIDVSFTGEYLWTRLGDDAGKPLYTYNQDAPGQAPSCVDECAKDFSPYLAARNAAPSGEWSLIDAPGSAGKQWAYQGLPLYRYNGQDPVEPRSRGDRGVVRSDGLADPGNKVYVPKEGWKRAAFLPEQANPTPAGIELVSLPVANGYGFIHAQTKRPLYVMEKAPKNVLAWTPAYAPAIALPIGDFTVITREDGKNQWAYKNQPLYTYNEDHSDTDLSGALVEKDAQPALAYRHFQPREISIGYVPTRGPIMTNTKGMTVYTQVPYVVMYGGRETRSGYRPSYTAGKNLGGKGCVDACLKTWTPVAAPANAQSSGFWEVVTRPDGSKQWAYKGIALYTHNSDKKPGDINGNNIHDVVYGDKDGKVDMSLTTSVGGFGGGSGSGFYWRMVTFFN
jgi:predicted lipoprotein with Yx(FWY)xxD motif